MRIDARLALGLTSLLVTLACSAKIEGPTPNVAGLDPSLVCGEQLTTEIAISGAGLSPLAIDSATGDPRLAIPDVTLERVQDLTGMAVTGAPVTLPNDPMNPAMARVRWTSSTSMAFDVYPELMLAPGLYQITVTNRNGRAFTAMAALTVVPRPELDAVEPDLVCTDQGDRLVTLRGRGFLSVGNTLPTVTFGDVLRPVDALQDCAPLPGPTVAQTCLTAIVTLPQDMPVPGAHAVVLENPEPAACHSEDAVTIAVVPQPTLESVVPDLICDAQGDRTLTLTGTGFVAVGATLPTVTIGDFQAMAATADGCGAIEGTLLPAQSCTTLTVVVPAGTLTPGVHDVSVENPDPAGCVTEEAITIAVVPPPSLVSVVPDLVCLDEGDRSLTLSGSGFVVVDGVLPTVSVGGVAVTTDSAAGCAPIAGTTLDAESCDTLNVTVPGGLLAPGAYPVVVGNPDPAGCSSTELVTVAVVPEPTVSAVAPDLFCADGGAVTLTIDGTGFVRAGTDLPIVHFGATTVVASGVSGCAAIAGTLLDAESCTSLTVTVAPGAVPPGTHDLVVENPAPAGCSSNEAITVEVAAAPTIASIEPPAVCFLAQPAEMVIHGGGFLVVSGAQPTVTIDGAAATVTGVTGCVPLGGTALPTDSCTEITFAVPAGGFAVGTHTVLVANPPPAGCATQVSGSFDVASAPTITSVVPFKVCGTEGDVFAVNGANFVPASQILLDGATPVPTGFLSSSQLEGTLAPGAVSAGLYDVTVQNGPGCEATLPNALNVVDAPVVFFVDPPQVYNGIHLQVTIYVSGVTDDITAVGIRPTGTMLAPTPLVFAYDPGRPNRILATVPAATAAGDYDVVIEDIACGATLVNGLHVTDTLAITVTSIDPPFGATTEPTGVAVTGAGFLPTPRAYLNPSSGVGIARELRAVSFQDATRLTAVVPDGLPVGTYDLIVINPDGTVGLLSPDAYRVLAAPPPEITDLLPGLVAKQTGQTVTVLGTGFAGPVTVTARCRAAGGLETVVTAAVGATSATSVATTWDMSGLAGGEVCVVRLTNADGTYADFSALSVTNPSNNLNAFQPDSDMTVGRRAAAGAAVRMNAVSRFLFAIGGDSGLPAPTRHASVEAAPVDPFGDVGSWAPQRNALPEGRSFISGTVIGRFIYVAGGNTGAPSASVLRAYLLDPFEAPDIDDLDLAKGTGAGLDGGIWYYRIAAVMAAGDPNNPGGEALPSEPLVVQLPALPEKVHLTLYWTPVPGAASYRIYRTPAPGMIAGDERFLAEVAAGGTPPLFLDDGSLSVDPARTVMPLGSLGVWHEVGPMASAREGAAIVAVRDPNVPGLHYLYVVGGRGAGGIALATYEWTSILSSAENDQAIGGWAVGGNTLPAGRWQMGAVFTDGTRASAVPATDAWIYVMTGMDGAGAAVNQITAFKVDTADGVGPGDGRLGVAVAVDAPNAGAGCAYAAGNEFLYLLGGGGSPSNTGRSAKICDLGEAGCGGGPPEPPDLVNWNAGFSLGTARYLHAVAVESGFIFLLGGATTTEAASATTERTNF